MSFLNYSFLQQKISCRPVGWVVYLLMLTSCAQVVAPGGGKKDIAPPKVLKYSPNNASINFISKSILIHCDEFIQLKDLNSQLIISPPLLKIPTIEAQKKNLSIVFDKKEILKPNTTYTISFGDAVRDVNENNPIENFNYIFSTGSFIDSLSLKGKVQNAFNHSTEKGIVVMLFNDINDSVVYKKLPDYFAKTNVDGTFQINNIKSGKYKLVALKDVNANYKYDGETENIGFVDSLVDVGGKKAVLIDLFQEPTTKVYLKKYIHDSYGKIMLIFNQGSKNIRVDALNPDFKDDQALLDFSKTRDTLTYWIKDYRRDSLRLKISNGATILDTLEFKMIKKEDALKSKKNKLQLKLVNSPNGNQGFDLNGEIGLLFSHPISTIQGTQQIQFTEDTTLFKTKLIPCLYARKPSFIQYGYMDSSMLTERIGNSELLDTAPVFKSFRLKENTNYHLFIPPGTFTDIFGLTNDSIKIDFKTKEANYYGSVNVNLIIPETQGNYLVQLLDEQDQLVREKSVKKSEVLTFLYLYPRKYKLKIIYDENNNQKWDTGSYFQKKQPEKIIYNPEPITIRSNWDADLEWKITEKE